MKWSTRIRRDRAYVDAMLAEHDARKSDDGQVGVCCVFADELRAVRTEYEALSERTSELVALLEYFIAVDTGLVGHARADVQGHVRAVRAVLGPTAKAEA